MEGMVARGTRSRAARIAPATQTPRCRSYALHRTDPPAAPTIVDRSVFNGSFCFAFLECCSHTKRKPSGTNAGYPSSLRIIRRHIHE